MNATLRALPLVLFATWAVTPLRAQAPAGEPLPSIFSTRVATKLPSPAIQPENHSSPLMSPHVRAALTERVLASKPTAENAPQLEVGSVSPMAWPKPADAIVMERFVLSLPPMRRFEAPPPESGLLRFAKTGTFFRYVGPTRTVEGDVRLLELRPLGVSQQEHFFRFELGFHISW